MSAALTLTHVSEPDLLRLAEEIAFALSPGDTIALEGDLGAGKTTFARALIRALSDGAISEVPSPTFTLVQEYRGDRFHLVHVDLYRLKPVEVDDLGLEEITLDGGVTAIEWPDRLPRAFEHAVRVEIQHVDESTRRITIRSAER